MVSIDQNIVNLETGISKTESLAKFGRIINPPIPDVIREKIETANIRYSKQLNDRLSLKRSAIDAYSAESDRIYTRAMNKLKYDEKKFINKRVSTAKATVPEKIHRLTREPNVIQIDSSGNAEVILNQNKIPGSIKSNPVNPNPKVNANGPARSTAPQPITPNATLNPTTSATISPTAQAAAAQGTVQRPPSFAGSMSEEMAGGGQNIKTVVEAVKQHTEDTARAYRKPIPEAKGPLYDLDSMRIEDWGRARPKYIANDTWDHIGKQLDRFPMFKNGKSALGVARWAQSLPKIAKLGLGLGIGAAVLGAGGWALRTLKNQVTTLTGGSEVPKIQGAYNYIEGLAGPDGQSAKMRHDNTPFGSVSIIFKQIVAGAKQMAKTYTGMGARGIAAISSTKPMIYGPIVRRTGALNGHMPGMLHLMRKDAGIPEAAGFMMDKYGKATINHPMLRAKSRAWMNLSRRSNPNTLNQTIISSLKPEKQNVLWQKAVNDNNTMTRIVRTAKKPPIKQTPRYDDLTPGRSFRESDKLESITTTKASRVTRPRPNVPDPVTQTHIQKYGEPVARSSKVNWSSKAFTDSPYSAVTRVTPPVGSFESVMSIPAPIEGVGETITAIKPGSYANNPTLLGLNQTYGNHMPPFKSGKIVTRNHLIAQGHNMSGSGKAEDIMNRLFVGA